jgi:hypothetical protein
VPALPAGSIIPPEIQKRAIEPQELTCGHVSALAIFGPENYAYRLGLIGAPSRICQALAPLAFGLLIEPMGRLVVAVSAGLSLAALVALLVLHRSSTIAIAQPKRASAQSAAAAE